jgi:Rrf2 family cysteine metabolism transcriptional repressor
MYALLGISQKCLYALHTMLELAQHYPSEAVVTVREIAGKQHIPVRFLEQILSKLRTAGYVISYRGKSGGFVIGKGPGEVSVGEIIRLVDGPVSSLQCNKSPQGDHCPMKDRCVFKGLWHRANDAMVSIFDKTTFRELIDQQRKAGSIPDYSI